MRKFYLIGLVLFSLFSSSFGADDTVYWNFTDGSTPQDRAFLSEPCHQLYQLHF